MIFIQPTTFHFCHSGSTKDYSFALKLKQILNDIGYFLEVNMYQKGQNVEELLYRGLKKAIEQELPVICLVTKDFLDLIVPTIYKSLVISLLTKHPQRQSLHIRDIDENALRQYSFQLAVNSPKFSVITKKELENISENIKWVSLVRILLHPPEDTTKSLNNYSIEDSAEVITKSLHSHSIFEDKPGVKPVYEKEFGKENEKAFHSNAKPAGSSSATDITHNPDTFKKTRTEVSYGPGVYKEAFGQWAKNSFQSSVSGSVSVVRDGKSNSHPDVSEKQDTSNENSLYKDDTDASKSKKRKKKKRRQSSKGDILQVLLREASFSFLRGIGNILDGRNGVNWRDFAKMFGLSAEALEQLQKAPGSPSDNMFKHLFVTKPTLLVRDIFDIATKLHCEDIVRFIEQN